jgi:hypothetical protein
MVVHELLVETEPEYRARRLEAEQITRETVASGEAARVMPILITIPVVIHVVHGRGEGNVSDDQVRSQIETLTADYRAQNADIDSVPDPWKSLVTDANIEFELATTDPGGGQTSGITRTETDVPFFRPDNLVKSAATGGADPWPTDRYVNVWVCDLGPRLLGYAQFPGGPAATDGVVISYAAFGSGGTAEEPFNRGRTATHEVGHFLGLRHIWGDMNDCTGSDFVDDTPSARAANIGKPEFPHITCDNGPEGDMFMNYMDYVDDESMCMFTLGQVARMNATLAGPRKALAGL